MPIPHQPFREIALCLSGGGYRAAGFHLGSMSYLNRINVSGGTLLQRVKAISTVSGGTIIGATYVLYDAQGKNFIEFYNDFRKFLSEHDLISESLEKLGSGEDWKYENKRRNLINSFAEIYDELLTGGAQMSEIGNSDKGHIELCAFNTTEFSYGINFRFQIERVNGQPNKSVKRGNSYINVAYKVQEEVRLSDVIAASSCFPGGFEPMRFPHDFTGPGSVLLESIKEKEPFTDGVALRDGGIYDNQGIDSIRLSERRRAKRHHGRESQDNPDRLPYELLIISDVSSPDVNNPFEFHKAQDSGISHFSYDMMINRLRSMGHLSTWVAALLIGNGIIMGLINDWNNNIITGIAIMVSLLGVVILILKWYAVRKLKGLSQEASGFIKDSIDDFYLKKLSTLDFKKYSLRQLEPLIMDRVNSVSLMVQDLFLKQVRRLKYRSIYEDSVYKNRRIANLIKELTRDDWSKTMEYQKLANIDDLLTGDYENVIGSRIGSLVKEASSFGTTLWFTEDDQLKEMEDKLIVTGQLTMCFNLMVQVETLRNSEDWEELTDADRKEVNAIFQQCKDDWVKLKEDPSILLDG